MKYKRGGGVMINRMKEMNILIIAAAVGTLTGLAASAFNRIIILGTQFTKPILETIPIMFIIFPLIAALFTAILYKKQFKHKANGMGVVQVLYEINQPNSHLMEPRNVFWNIVATCMTLISGMTAGRFGPITHLGAAIGSNISLKLGLDDEQRMLIIGCGVAGTIATVFNMPFFATMFVMEVIYRKRNFKVLAPVIISAVIADRVGVYFFGERTQIISQLGAQLSIQDITLPCILLGICVGVISSLYIESLERVCKAMEVISKRWLRLVIAAIAVGISAYFFPNQFEIHYDTTNYILTENVGILLILVLIFIRILTTALTLGSGFVGGNFYPGVTIGGATGVLAWKLFDLAGLNVPTRGEMGILGIVGVLAGFLHAPFTSIVFALETSKNSNIIIPAMIVSAVSLTVSYVLCGRDIFAKPLGRIISSFKIQTIPER